jgi:hypothetical protein
MRDRKLVEPLTKLKERKPWGDGSPDIDNVVESYLQNITKYGQTDDPFLLPVMHDEYVCLEGLVEHVPKLEAAGMSPEVIAAYTKDAWAVARDSRNHLRGIDDSRKYFAEKDKISNRYMRMLAEDAIALKEKGMPDEGIRAFMHFARRTCFAGRVEHDHLNEAQRFANYQQAREMIYRLMEKKSFLDDPIHRIEGIFSSIVYGDRFSGISTMRNVMHVPGGVVEWHEPFGRKRPKE